MFMTSMLFFRFDEQLRELKEEHEQQLQLQQLNFAEVQAIKTKQLENQIRTKLEVRKSHENNDLDIRTL